jgi:hypothetical protein
LDLSASAAHKDKREGQYDCGEHKGEKTLAREAHGENLLFFDSDLVRIERAPIVHQVRQNFSTLSATGANAFGRFGYNGL